MYRYAEHTCTHADMVPGIHVHVRTSLASVHTRGPSAQPLPPTHTTLFSGMCARSVPCARCARGSVRPALPRMRAATAPLCPQVTSSCCSAPPNSGRCSRLSAPTSGSTWPVSTLTTWSLFGGSPTLCPTSSTAGKSQGVASLQSLARARARAGLGLHRQQVGRNESPLARTEPGTGAASAVL